jgi:hypothetical protein
VVISQARASEALAAERARRAGMAAHGRKCRQLLFIMTN